MPRILEGCQTCMHRADLATTEEETVLASLPVCPASAILFRWSFLEKTRNDHRLPSANPPVGLNPPGSGPSSIRATNKNISLWRRAILEKSERSDRSANRPGQASGVGARMRMAVKSSHVISPQAVDAGQNRTGIEACAFQSGGGSYPGGNPFDGKSNQHAKAGGDNQKPKHQHENGLFGRHSLAAK